MGSGAKMLLSEPTTKNAARAKGKAWRQEILDMCRPVDLRRSGLLGRREDIASGRRASDMLRTLDPEVHTA